MHLRDLDLTQIGLLAELAKLGSVSAASRRSDCLSPLPAMQCYHHDPASRRMRRNLVALCDGSESGRGLPAAAAK